MFALFFFFFSSRRRHTRFDCDWSSDVCSSDLTLGSVTRPAEALPLTQPAITAQIKALEEELGVALFDRRPGRISLTRAGEALMEPARQVLDAAGRLQGQARELQGEITGQLLLGTVADPEALRLGSLLHEIGRASCRGRV